jgi:hypothetical protein
MLRPSLKTIGLVMIGLLVCGAILFGAAFAADPNAFRAQATGITGITGDKTISVDSAMEKVRAYNEKPGEKVTYKGIATAPHGKAFELATDDGTYYVNTATGDVELAYFKHGNNGLSDIKLTKDQAQNKALAYAKKYYRDYLNKSMQLVRSEVLDHGDAGKEYVFIWNEEINGVYTLNQVMVTVDPGTGEVASYVGIQRPLLVKPELVISKDDAIDKAIGLFDGIFVKDSSAEPHIVYLEDGTQCVAWIVEVTGEEKDGGIPGGSVTIDAVNGEILSVDPYL